MSTSGSPPDPPRLPSHLHWTHHILWLVRPQPFDQTSSSAIHFYVSLKPHFHRCLHFLMKSVEISLMCALLMDPSTRWTTYTSYQNLGFIDTFTCRWNGCLRWVHFEIYRSQGLFDVHLPSAPPHGTSTSASTRPPHHQLRVTTRNLMICSELTLVPPCLPAYIFWFIQCYLSTEFCLRPATFMSYRTNSFINTFHVDKTKPLVRPPRDLLMPWFSQWSPSPSPPLGLLNWLNHRTLWTG